MNTIPWKDLKDNLFTKAMRNVLMSWELASLRSSKIINLSYPMLLHSLRRPRPSGHPREHDINELTCNLRLIRPDKKEVTDSLDDLVKDTQVKK